MAARNRRSPGAARLRPRDVFLHIFAFLQSRTRQFLLRHHGSVASFPRLVVANSGCQFYTLCRRNDPFFAGALGALSTPALSLHIYRNRPAIIGAKHSAVDRESFGGHATGWPAVWARSTSLRGNVVGLLGHPPLHDRGSVSFNHCGLGTCLHRPLLLAASETFFQVGRPVFAGNCRAAPAAGNDRRPSRRSRGDRTSSATAMAKGMQVSTKCSPPPW